MATGLPVSVLGGTGFLGRRVVATLAAAGWRVRMVARRPQAWHPGTGVEAVAADIRNAAVLAAALDGAAAVVNAVGLYVERGAETFDAVHVLGARRIAEHAAAGGVARLVHVSGIGVDGASPSAYVRARAHGEQAVREAFPGATVLRPSVLYGAGDALLSTLDAMSRLTPVLPLFGRGETRLQPVHVDDVAAAVVRVLEQPASAGQVYELGGPRTWTYRELVELVLHHRARHRPLLPVPFVTWDLIARVAGAFPDPPLTRDQVALMREDNVVAPGALGFAELGLSPRDLEQALPQCLPRRR
jgi:NADH dehydrogenase